MIKWICTECKETGNDYPCFLSTNEADYGPDLCPFDESAKAEWKRDNAK